MVWKKEYLLLHAQRRRLQAEVDNHLAQSSEADESLFHIYKDFEKYDNKLSYEFIEFKQGTLDPVWALR